MRTPNHQANSTNLGPQLLDFDRYRDWTHTSRWAITTDKKVQDLKPGDVIRVDLGSMSFRPALVVTNSFFCLLGRFPQ